MGQSFTNKGLYATIAALHLSRMMSQQINVPHHSTAQEENTKMFEDRGQLTTMWVRTSTWLRLSSIGQQLLATCASEMAVVVPPDEKPWFH